MTSSTTARQGFVAGQCLVAMPSQEGTWFEKSVIYMIEHNHDGAFGLVINKPIEVSVDEILGQFNEQYSQPLHPEPVYVGGPVENERGFVLHHPDPELTWEQQVSVSEEVAITTSADILVAMTNGTDVHDYMVLLGYSGWGPGQLDDEITDNAWMTVDIPVTRLLALPCDERLGAALQSLGIRYSQLGNEAGHA